MAMGVRQGQRLQVSLGLAPIGACRAPQLFFLGHKIRVEPHSVRIAADVTDLLALPMAWLGVYVALLRGRGGG